MRKYRITQADADLRPGLEAIGLKHPDRFCEQGTPLRFVKEPTVESFAITVGEEGVTIRYARISGAFRGLGLVLAGIAGPQAVLKQASAFDSVGVMLDVSRNGVLSVEALRSWMVDLALMGINSLQLYMEDVYTVPGEPFFGYFRGAYSTEELKEIDDIGFRLGIEVIPCIQTLGHLEQVLQWPAYSRMADVRGVLLADAPESYALIGKMLDLTTACFRSKRIHIGMDEAHGVGTGNFLRRHGWQRPFDILNRHLDKVTAMCAERGLQPMMWSDMYFRIGSETNDYYDPASTIPEEVITAMSPHVELVYWDYYHSDSAFYEEWIRRHRAMGKEPVFAAGAWSWGRFWTHRSRWQESISAGMQAARTCGINSAFITVWGDDGWECHPFSVLPAIQYFAEWAYVGQPDDDVLQRQFELISPATSLASCHLASDLDEAPATRGRKEPEANFSKWILWHDPVLGFLNGNLFPDLPGHYRKLADQLESCLTREGGPLQLPAALARTLQFKSELHLRLRPAYLAGDVAALQDLHDRVLPATLDALEKLWEIHRLVWQQWFKPFGWEVIDRRYGGINARLKTLQNLLEGHLASPDTKIAELELEPFPVGEDLRPEKTYFDYARVITPSAIK